LTNGKDCHRVRLSPEEKEIAMATMNISLPEQMKAWVEECVKSGRYAKNEFFKDVPAGFMQTRWLSVAEARHEPRLRLPINIGGGFCVLSGRIGQDE
jgi:hypothetical protein